MPDLLRSPRGLLGRPSLPPTPPDDRHAPLPPPPPLGSSRPDRVVYRLEDHSPSAGRSPSSHPVGRRHSPRGPPEDAPLPLPPSPPLGSSRPERVVYRLEGDSPRDGRSSGSPGGAGGAPRRSRSEDKDKWRRSPPRRSPPPLPKRQRRDEGAGRAAGVTVAAESGAGLLGIVLQVGYGVWRGGGDEVDDVDDELVRKREGERRPPLLLRHRRLTLRAHHGASQEHGLDSGYGDSSNVQDITQRKGLMTYKQFTQVLEDDVSPAEAEGRYREYKTAYVTTQKRAYFDQHKDEIWLKERYHPTNLLSVIERRNEFCKAAAKNLILDLRSRTLDLGSGLTPGAASNSGNDNDGSSENDEHYGNKRRKNGRGPPKEPGSPSTAPKAHPVSSKYRRIQTDIDQTLALVQKLDAEKGIVGNILSTRDHGKSDVDRSHVGSMGPIVIVRGLTTAKGLEGVELLDTLLTYLWRVHGVDYYGMYEMRDAKGFRHVRADKSASAFNISAADWENKLDSFWHKRLVNGEDPLVILTAKDKIDAVTVETLDSYIKKIMDEMYGWKYGCGAKGCTKVFHAPEFVHKHLTLKHPDLVSVLTSRVQEDIYCQNYMNDPHAPGGIPVMQQSFPSKIMQQSAPSYMQDRVRRIPDEQILGTFDVPGPTPFVPEFPPPPLLIPVPGAGPLGPFVPIPPQMAIQMMRQQRPPRPKGAQRGKELLLPGPMMPMYPHFPHEPRPLRCYDDLDALEEEVTLIDSRGL